MSAPQLVLQDGPPRWLAVTLAPPNLQNSGDNAALATGTNRPTTVANLHPDNVYLLDQLLVHSSLQDTNGVGISGSDPLAPCPVDCPPVHAKGNQGELGEAVADPAVGGQASRHKCTAEANYGVTQLANIDAKLARVEKYSQDVRNQVKQCFKTWTGKIAECLHDL